MSELKTVLAREGRSARNLNNYIVPIKDENNTENSENKQNSTQNRSRNKSAKSNSSNRRRNNSQSGGRIALNKQIFINPSDSATSVSIRARYWKLLFDNLQRAVDDIYDTCQQDKNPDECKETILILKNYQHEFESLSNWIKLEKDLESENSEKNGKKGAKPVALAWEVRKTTPIRNNSGNTEGGDRQPNKQNSWADKVKSVGDSSWVVVGNKNNKSSNKQVERKNSNLILESNYTPITEESSLETPKKSARSEFFEENYQTNKNLCAFSSKKLRQTT